MVAKKQSKKATPKKAAVKRCRTPVKKARGNKVKQCIMLKSKEQIAKYNKRVLVKV